MWTLYRIRNKKNNRAYIGITTKYRTRKINHFTCLRLNKHINKPLQSDFNKGHLFSCKAICTLSDREAAMNFEKKYISKCKNPYNGNAGGGVRMLEFDKKISVNLFLKTSVVEKYGGKESLRNKLYELLNNSIDHYFKTGELK